MVLFRGVLFLWSTFWIIFISISRLWAVHGRYSCSRAIFFRFSRMQFGTILVMWTWNRRKTTRIRLSFELKSLKWVTYWLENSSRIFSEILVFWVTVYWKTHPIFLRNFGSWARPYCWKTHPDMDEFSSNTVWLTTRFWEKKLNRYSWFFSLDEFSRVKCYCVVVRHGHVIPNTEVTILWGCEL